MTTTTTTPAALAQIAGSYTIDPSHSRLGFVARHAMVTKVRGQFRDFEGSFTVDADDLSKSSAVVTIQAKSIDTGNADRDNHLRSNDFFDMDRYPTLSFVATEVKPVDDTTVRLTGDLTIKDVTKAIAFDLEYEGAAVDPFGNSRVGFEGSVDINRKDWNVNWNAALEAGGVLVSEKVSLEFEISAIKA